MKFIILVVTSKTHIAEGTIQIDRVDLTRKLDSINTWVGDVLNSGNEVIFVDGDNEKEWYDEHTKTLHLMVDDKIDGSDTTSLFIKGKEALRWIYNNREFDYVYSCDDDVYINIPEFLKLEIVADYTGTGPYGGGGGFYNRKAIECIMEFENEHFKVADQAIYNAIISNPNITKNFSNHKSSVFYFPGELYATIHYVSGKRVHYLHNTFRYFHENGYTNRKIVLFGPFNPMIENDIISYETTARKKTKRWYDFTVDPNGWEYHGGYTRSQININTLIGFWPYAENSTKFFVINFNHILADYVGGPLFNQHLQYLINQCEKSLINKNNLLLCSHKLEEIDGWVLDNSVREKYRLTFEHLNDFNFYKKITNNYI